jgi:hypothetical protein
VVFTSYIGSDEVHAILESLRKEPESYASFSAGMKKMKLGDKKLQRVSLPSMASSSSASFHRSREQGPKTPITAQLIELRGLGIVAACQH